MPKTEYVGSVECCDRRTYDNCQRPLGKVRCNSDEEAVEHFDAKARSDYVPFYNNVKVIVFEGARMVTENYI